MADNQASTLPAHTKPGAVADNQASTLAAHTKPGAVADSQASTLPAHTKPGAVADNQASTLAAHTKPGAVADNKASTLPAHTKPGAVADNKASTLPAHTKPGAVADNKASTLPAHTKPGAVADNKASTLLAHTKPGAVADNKASTLPAHTKPGAGSPHPQSALAQSYHTLSTDYGGDGIGPFSKPLPLPPRTHASPPGFGGVPSTKPSVSATSHTPSSGSVVGGVPSTRPPVSAASYSRTSSLYDDGGHSSNVAATGPPAILDTTAGPYYQDPQGHTPRASTHREAPSGYHPQQQLPGQSQRGTASPYHANLHPGYSAVSPASVPPVSTISSEAESFHKHAYDDSNVHSGHHHDFVEKDSPPSSNISSQSAPDASQQMLQYSGRGGSRQPQPQQAPYGVTAGAGSSQAGPLPSGFSPPGGYAHSANVCRPVQETQQGPFGQTQPSSQAAYTSPNTSQPGQGMVQDLDTFDVGIKREIYHVAKDVIRSDSEAPQTLADEGIPHDPNLVCQEDYFGV